MKVFNLFLLIIRRIQIFSNMNVNQLEIQIIVWINNCKDTPFLIQHYHENPSLKIKINLLNLNQMKLKIMRQPLKKKCHSSNHRLWKKVNVYNNNILSYYNIQRNVTHLILRIIWIIWSKSYTLTEKVSFRSMEAQKFLHQH